MAFAFIFDTVSGGEWLVLLAVILIVVGPKNLPSAARKTGEILAKLRRAADEFKRQLMTMDQEVSRTVNDVAGELKHDYMDVPSDDLAGTDQGGDVSSGEDDYMGETYGDAGPDFDEVSPHDDGQLPDAGLAESAAEQPAKKTDTVTNEAPATA